MKICIYGAGAIGGYLGVQLARAGVDVSLVARGAHLAAMRANGLKLLIGDEERVVHPRCTDNPAELGPQEVQPLGEALQLRLQEEVGPRRVDHQGDPVPFDLDAFFRHPANEFQMRVIAKKLDSFSAALSKR